LALEFETRLRALHLGITVMQGHRLRALRLDITRMALISLASELWTLLSDDLSSVIFRQSQNPLQNFQNSAIDLDRFQNTLDFSFGNKHSRMDWQSSEIP